MCINEQIILCCKYKNKPNKKRGTNLIVSRFGIYQAAMPLMY
jgi:hypothetical protein